MAQKYYSLTEVARLLGISEDDVKQMQTQRELHGYRDGATWKFKAEEIERLARERGAPAASAEEGDMLLSELELGASDPGASGTVIGMEGNAKGAAESDIQLAGDSTPSAGRKSDIGSSVSKFEELDLALDEDLSLDDNQTQPAAAKAASISDLVVAGKDLDDDDLVLGGSGTGSDITIGGDSGISLVDPADSGLSLEEPLDLVGSAEALELGEADVVALGDAATGASPAAVKTDDDFLLTPLEEAPEEEESESGSQVIALDSEGDEAGAVVAAAPSGPSLAAMLDEDMSAAPAADLGLGAPLEAAQTGVGILAAQPGAFAQGATVPQPTAMLAEMPYTTWNIVSLALCTLLLLFCGMFMYDLLRNMWSWDAPYSINSSLMDTILSWFGG
jgi:excisionase family DNA binding protein